MKVNFIPFYFLMKIQDVPLATEWKSGHTPVHGQDYMTLRNKWHLCAVYTKDLINIPTQGIGGQLIT
jgi:hypothetical protein